MNWNIGTDQYEDNFIPTSTNGPFNGAYDGTLVTEFNQPPLSLPERYADFQSSLLDTTLSPDGENANILGELEIPAFQALDGRVVHAGNDSAEHGIKKR